MAVVSPGTSPLPQEKSAISTIIAGRLIFWQLLTADPSQVAFVFFLLLARQCWSRPSPTFSMEVRFARIQAWSRVRASASIIEWSMASSYSEIVTATDLRFERILK
ncbi:hypothetical protein J3A65_004754 [Rhizobium sp. PvP014]|nr:hypothetical protein [Rhizobium sp. PvP014]MBP2532293.1 hypothetical protein [Rhizobium sp. PvP099]